MNKFIDNLPVAASIYSNSNDGSFYLCHEDYSYGHSTPFLSNKGITYLNLGNVQKMIKKFLDEKGMPKEELADVLEITVKSLERLFSDDFPPNLLHRVSFPLARLYCETKW
jgi:hypothetical protein